MFKKLKKIIIVSVCLLSFTFGLIFNTIKIDASEVMKCYNNTSVGFGDVMDDIVEPIFDREFDYIFLGKAKKINNEGLLEFDVKYVYKGEVGEKISVDVFSDDIRAKYSLKYKKIVDERKRVKLKEEKELKKIGEDYDGWFFSDPGCYSCQGGGIELGQQYRVYADYNSKKGEYYASSCSVIKDDSNPIVTSAGMLVVLFILICLVVLKFRKEERVKTVYALKTGVLTFIVWFVFGFIVFMACELEWINYCMEYSVKNVFFLPFAFFYYPFRLPTLIPGAFAFSFLHILGLIIGLLLVIIILYLFGYLIRFIAGVTVKVVKKITKR